MLNIRPNLIANGFLFHNRLNTIEIDFKKSCVKVSFKNIKIEYFLYNIQSNFDVVVQQLAFWKYLIFLCICWFVYKPSTRLFEGKSFKIGNSAIEISALFCCIVNRKKYAFRNDWYLLANFVRFPVVLPIGRFSKWIF